MRATPGNRTERRREFLRNRAWGLSNKPSQLKRHGHRQIAKRGD